MMATVEQQNDGLYRVLVDGNAIVVDETFGVCDAIAEAINHPELWEPTEAYEIAEQYQ
jgi:hypothetical protein